MQVAERKNRRGVILEHLGSAHTQAELAALMNAGRDEIDAEAAADAREEGGSISHRALMTELGL